MVAPLNGELRLLAALESPDPREAAIRLAEALKAEGIGQLALYRVFAKVQLQLEDGDPRYDAVLDTMDCIVGWCHPSARLYDTNLSNDEIASDRDE